MIEAINKTFYVLILTAIFILSAAQAKSENIPVYGYKVVNTFPHDSKAFTQGLIFQEGKLYEGTGHRGHSELRQVDIETGKPINSHKIADRYFGEGIAYVNGEIVQLTWQSGTGFVYNAESLKPVGKFRYDGEGWGLTYDGKHLIMSDGSSVLKFLDPRNFTVMGKLDVYDNRGAVARLNELEYVEGQIFANIWGQERIARINPSTGSVVGWIDLSGLKDLLPDDVKNNPIDVLNGIAYEKETKRLLVTGKYWPKMFEIEILPPANETKAKIPE